MRVAVNGKGYYKNKWKYGSHANFVNNIILILICYIIVYKLRKQPPKVTFFD